MEAKPERLQKILAAAGLASRRKAEELIAAGVVSVNGEIVTEPGTKADPRIDEIRVDGKLLRGPERHVYLAVYKPKGHMTTVSDPEGRPTVMDLLKGVDERVFPVGRLDYMSEGLLLLTNDGDLMAQLTKAGSHVAKTYMVKVSGKPTEEEIDKLRNGIMLPPEPGLTGVRGKKQPGVERRSFAILTQPADIQLAVDQENPWYEVTLTEGRNRQIRRMFEQIGYHIEKIKRVRYGSLTLDVEPGEFRHLTPKEVNALRKSLDTPFKPKAVKVKRKDDRPERRPRVDAARFVKGRRGKPSADAPAARPFVARSSAGARPSAGPRREFTPREGAGEGGFQQPRGPEFGRETVRRDSGFAAKRPYAPKPVREFEHKGGDSDERPRRTYAPKATGSFERKPGSDRKPSFDRKPAAEGFAKREGGREGGYVKRPAAKREEGFGQAPAKRDTSATGGFGFSRFAKPKFVKPSKHRDLGSDSTHGVDERKAAERPYAKPAGDRGFAKRAGTPTGERKYTKGPGKPAAGGYAPRSDYKPRATGGDFKRPGGDFKPRAGGDFKPRSGGDFKPRSGGDYKPRAAGGDFKHGGEGRPPARSGGFGKSFGAGSKPGFGAKRPGFGASRGTGRPSAPPRGGSGPRRPSGPPRRRPEEE